MTAENLREQIKKYNVEKLLPLLDVPDETKDILSRFSAGQSCSVIGKSYGVSGNRIKQTILSAANRGRFLSIFASQWSNPGLNDVILNAPDLSQKQRRVLLDLSEMRSIPAVSQENQCDSSYVYRALRKFYFVTKPEYRSMQEQQAEIGEHMRIAREKCGVSLKEAAQHIQISEKQLARYEHGRCSQPADLLSKLAKFYGVTLDVFLTSPAQ